MSTFIETALTDPVYDEGWTEENEATDVQTSDRENASGSEYLQEALSTKQSSRYLTFCPLDHSLMVDSTKQPVNASNLLDKN